MARATGGGVEFWLGLPIHELMRYLLELAEQIDAENAHIEKASRG